MDVRDDDDDAEFEFAAGSVFACPSSERGEDAGDGDECAEQNGWCGGAKHEFEGLGAGALAVEGHVWAA